MNRRTAHKAMNERESVISKAVHLQTQTSKASFVTYKQTREGIDILAFVKSHCYLMIFLLFVIVIAFYVVLCYM